MKNMVYVGALAALLDIDMAALEQLAQDSFGKRPGLVEANMKAIMMGRDYSLANFDCPLPFRVEPMNATGGMVMMDGNTTAGLGCVYAGATVGAWYPITPSTSLMDAFRSFCARFRADPDTRERLMAGALLPAQWLMKAQKFRRAYRDAVLALLRDVDVILAPATPCAAPLLGQKKFTLDGVELNVRANVGVFTQPISFIGLPVVVAPIWLPGAKMPLGVQIIAAPWREDAALRMAAALETLGAASAPVAN
jgi:hypothetical protein